MTVTMSVPAHLQGQRVDALFDVGLVGIARGAGPTGVLGTTITLPLALQKQATDLGFLITGSTTG